MRLAIFIYVGFSVFSLSASETSLEENTLAQPTDGGNSSEREGKQLLGFVRRQGELSGRRDRPCTTPNGAPGLCQDVTQCPALLLDLGTLVRSICFQSLFRPGTCCPLKDQQTSAASKPETPTTSTVKPSSGSSTQKQSGFKKVTSSKRKTTTTPKPKIKSTTRHPITTRRTTRGPTTRPIQTTRLTTRRPAVVTSISATDGLNPPSVYPGSPQATKPVKYDCGKARVSQARVVNGTESYPGQWPWMAALYLHGFVRKEFHCGGSIISKEYIITAAHCMIDKRGRRYSPSQFSIRLGDHDLATSDQRLDKYVQTYRVESIKVHPQFENFNHQYFRNDIALLKLSRPIDFTPFVLPVCLPSKAMASAPIDSISGEYSTVIGYGRTSYSGPQSKKLLKAQMPVWWNKACDDAYFPPVLDTNVCAGFVEGGIDSCQGDSGGPLLIYRQRKWVLLGIVSFGQKCAEPGYPGVYTRVPKFLEWIIKNAAK